jgi:hypothetical protein
MFGKLVLIGKEGVSFLTSKWELLVAVVALCIFSLGMGFHYGEKYQKGLDAQVVVKQMVIENTAKSDKQQAADAVSTDFAKGQADRQTKIDVIEKNLQEQTAPPVGPTIPETSIKTSTCVTPSGPRLLNQNWIDLYNQSVELTETTK